MVHLKDYNSVLDKKAIAALPRFDLNEIIIDKLVGSGGFASVREVTGFRLEKGTNGNKQCGNDPRYQLKKKARHTPGRLPALVIKSLRAKENQTPSQLKFAMRSLVMEGFLMASLEHPNILSVQGLPKAPSPDDPASCFLILDRLYGTVGSRIRYWSKQALRLRRVAPTVSIARNKLDRMFQDRICIAREIASAMSYLHSRRIIFRDLKAWNIGVNQAGNVKLFDFGMAKPLPEAAATDPHATFHMTGLAGTLRYMSPEVLQSLPYNLKSDIYSLAVVIWELLSLSKPYSGFTTEEVHAHIVENKERPHIDDGWPKAIQELLQQSWHDQPQQRPSAQAFHSVLADLVEEVESTQPNGVLRRPRLSTKVHTDAVLV